MTPAEIQALLDSAESHFRATTITYGSWLTKVRRGSYSPPDGSTTEWGMGFLDIDNAKAALGTPTPTPTPPPTPPPTPTPLPPQVTNPAIVDGSTYVNAMFTTPVDVGNHHDLTFKNSAFKLGLSSSGSSYAHNISLSDCDITNPNGFGVKMASLDTNWSFLRTKIHDCASMAIVWNRYSSLPPNTKWGSGLSFISGEVWNTGLSDGEHAFYLNAHDVHIAGSLFHDYARSAISLRFGGANLEFNTFTPGGRSAMPISYYEYDGAPYKTIEIHRNLVTAPASDTDVWIGVTGEGQTQAAYNANYQTFNITDNCFPSGVKKDASLTPGPYLTTGNNSRCNDSGAAYYVG